jgi:glutamine synthetase
VPPSPRSGKRRHQAEILALRQLDAWDGFFTRLYEACEAMDIPADTTISEAGPGQFEVNLMHQPDALKAADDAWLFKLLVKGLARDTASPPASWPNPMPITRATGCTRISRCSTATVPTSSTNATKAARTFWAMRSRVPFGDAGLHADLRAACSSYDRFVPGAHAPTGIAWAHENRTALRVPSGGPAAAADRAPRRGG